METKKIQLDKRLQHKYQTTVAYLKTFALEFNNIESLCAFINNKDIIYLNKHSIFESANINNTAIFRPKIEDIKNDSLIINSLDSVLQIFYKKNKDNNLDLKVEVIKRHNLEDLDKLYIKTALPKVFYKLLLRYRDDIKPMLYNPEVLIINDDIAFFSDGLESICIKVDAYLHIAKYTSNLYGLELFREDVFNDRFLLNK